MVFASRDATSSIANARPRADAHELTEFDFGIVATKASQTWEAFAPAAHLFPHGAVLSAQNGLGSEEVMARVMPSGYVIRGTTFMSGTRFADDTCNTNWIPQPGWVHSSRPNAVRTGGGTRGADECRGLKAEALGDARPAQWSKLIFNASVNSVSALTELPHPHILPPRSSSEI